jgi:hypothetical protein
VRFIAFAVRRRRAAIPLIPVLIPGPSPCLQASKRGPPCTYRLGEDLDALLGIRASVPVLNSH